ncbi:ATP-dependent helicase NAM7 [Arthrobotrys megalospora]
MIRTSLNITLTSVGIIAWNGRSQTQKVKFSLYRMSENGEMKASNPPPADVSPIISPSAVSPIIPPVDISPIISSADSSLIVSSTEVSPLILPADFKPVNPPPNVHQAPAPHETEKKTKGPPSVAGATVVKPLHTVDVGEPNEDATTSGTAPVDGDEDSYQLLLEGPAANENGELRLPNKHHITVVEFDGQRFEFTMLRGSARILRNGTLAYVLEKGGLPNQSPEVIRLVLPALALKDYDLSGGVLTITFKKTMIDVTYPPALGEDECKAIFVTIQEGNGSEVKLHLGKASSRNLELLDGFLKEMLKGGTFNVPEGVFNATDYYMIHHSDYYSLHWETALKEIQKKASNAESTFGGVLETVKLESEDPDGQTIVIEHVPQQKKNMQFARIDEGQEFILHFPGGTRLEARWPKDHTEEYVVSKVFKLRIPGITERHRGIIQGYKQEDPPNPESQFRLEAIPNRTEQARSRKILQNIIQAYRKGDGFPVGPILYSHPDTHLGTEVEPDIQEMLSKSSLNSLQTTSAVHALCKQEQLPAGIALVTGAAGTGKTYTAATIIKGASISKEYNRIVVTAKQNTALERIFESTMNVLTTTKEHVLYIQGKMAAARMEITGTPELRELVKRYKLETHLGKLEDSQDSSSSKRTMIIGKHMIIFATLDMIQRDLDSTVFPANFVLIDEAGATSELDCLIPITKFNQTLKRVVLVGDAMQLLPYSPSTSPITRRSLFLRCQQSNWGVARLIDNYRMHPQVAGPLKRIFYNSGSMVHWGLLKHSTTSTSFLESTDAAEAVAGTVAMLEALRAFNKGIKSLTCWWNVPGYEQKLGSSFGNIGEIEAIIIFLQYIRSSQQMIVEGMTMSKIGVISPYLGQVESIREEIKTRFPAWIEEGLEIATIDGFQGREKDVMIISLVRSNDSGDVGFLNDAHRICTALSRARICQVLIANFDFLNNQAQDNQGGKKAKGGGGRNPENQQQFGNDKQRGRVIGPLMKRYRWNNFRDPRIEDFLKAKDEAEKAAAEKEIATEKGGDAEGGGREGGSDPDTRNQEAEWMSQAASNIAGEEGWGVVGDSKDPAWE